MKLSHILQRLLFSLIVKVTCIDGYITSDLPGHKHRAWLKEMTSDVCQLPIGHLTPELCVKTPELLSAWAQNPYITTAERLSQTTSKDGNFPHHGKECALECERLLKRLVDERRAGNLNAKVATTLYNSLMDVWSKSGNRLQAAQRTEMILGSMQNAYVAGDNEVAPDRESFKIVLNAWRNTAHHDQYSAHKAQSILEWMKHLYETGENCNVKPNSECFDIVLHAWALSHHSDAPEKTEELVSLMDALHLEGDDDMKPTLVSFNQILTAWSRYDSPEISRKLENILYHLRRVSEEEGNEDMKPDAVSYNAVIDAYAKSKSGDSAEHAEKILKEAEKQYIDHGDDCVNTFSFNVVSDAYAKKNSRNAFLESRSLLQRQSALYAGGLTTCKPDVYSYSSVLSACAAHLGSWKEKSKAFAVAQATFQEMCESDISLNHVTYGIMLKACAKLLRSGKDKRRFTNKYFKMARDSGCVGDMVVSKLREAATPEQYKILMNGATRSHLPEEWTSRVPQNDKNGRRSRTTRGIKY